VKSSLSEPLEKLLPYTGTLSKRQFVE